MPYVRYYDDQVRLTEFLGTSKIKRKLLSLWPKRVEAGIEIFDVVYWYYAWSGGIQKSANHKKIYDLIGVKYKPDNYLEVTAEYKRRKAEILQAYNGYTWDAEAQVPFTLPAEYAEYIDISNPDLDGQLRAQMRLEYAKFDECVSTDKTYLENIERGNMDRGYFYLGEAVGIENDNTLEDANGVVTFPAKLNTTALLAELTAAAPMIYPLHRDPFNADPLLPYQTVDPLDPLKMIWVTPELTDLNPNPLVYDANGWVTEYISVIGAHTINNVGTSDETGIIHYDPPVYLTNEEIENALQTYGFIPAVTTTEPNGYKTEYDKNGDEVIIPQYTILTEVNPGYISYSTPGNNKALLGALFDIDNTLFERQIRVVQREWGTYQVNGYVSQQELWGSRSGSGPIYNLKDKRIYAPRVVVEVRYRRVKNPTAIAGSANDMTAELILEYTRTGVWSGGFIPGNTIVDRYNAIMWMWVRSLLETAVDYEAGIEYLKINTDATLSASELYENLLVLSYVTDSATRDVVRFILDMYGFYDTSDMVIKTTVYEGNPKEDSLLRLRVDYVNNLKSKEVIELMGKCVHHGYTTEGKRFLESALGIIIVIAIVVVAFVYAPALGAYLAPAGAAAGATAAAVATTAVVGISTALSIASMAMYATAYYFSKNGKPGITEALSSGAMVTGVMASAIGVFSMVSNAARTIGTAVENAVKQGVIETIKTAVLETVTTIKTYVIDTFKTSVTNVTTTELINNVITYVNKAFSIYTKYINPPNEGLKELQDTVKKQEEELAALETNADTPLIFHSFLDSPFNNMYDMNEVMHNSYYSMTQGKIDNPMNRYYKGTEPFKYDPYWGS